MNIGAKTDRGQVREQNEDAYGYRDGLFVLADGMGGHHAGEVASAIAVETILATPLPSNEAPVAAALAGAVLRANQAILDRVTKQPEWIGMGTTVALLYFRAATAYFTHVGDSRIYQWFGGTLTQLTRDHSLVAELIENGDLTPEEAKLHPQRNILTSALGTEGIRPVDIQNIAIQKGDRFLLCSDGLTNMVGEEMIREALSAAKHPQYIADELVELANERGGGDNITVIIIEIE